jgi:DNA polymerase IV
VRPRAGHCYTPPMPPPTALCRACNLAWNAVPGAGRCPTCGSRRILVHPELGSLAVAHVDADAFYAAIEKRDDPALRDRPMIVGGGRRGVVSTACYLARLSGVRSAMPMFQALRLCPDAVVVRPRMDRYVEASRQIGAMMLELTPLVEPLSLDEAFLDLSGTERLHGAPPSVLLARLQARIERELGITVSVGLSHNKFLAKIASDLDKPRGFRPIGRAETLDLLRPMPISVIWGVGESTCRALESEGLRTVGDLRARGHDRLVRRFGNLGERLWRLCRGEDARPIRPDHVPKSISHETTFADNLDRLEALRWHLWSLAEQVSARAKARGLAGSVAFLKLKRSDHRILTRRLTLAEPTQMAARLYRSTLPMLQRDMAEAPFRLIGVGLATLTSHVGSDTGADLFAPELTRRLAAERAADRIRARFGHDSIFLGRSLR